MKELRAFTTSSRFPTPLIVAGNHFERKSLVFERTKALIQTQHRQEKPDVGKVLVKEKMVVKVDPRPRKNLAATIIDHIERLVISMHDSSRTEPTLVGNYGPVTEETPPVTDLPVTGHLPQCLDGAFMRVGPNPFFAPLANYHWFDGDGMIHSLRIKDGKATYVSRYVKTSRLKQEEFFGAAKIVKVGDLKGFQGLLTMELQILRQLTNVVDTSYGLGTANTALVYHNGSLLALNETDKPYVMKIREDGDIETIGLLDYEKKLKHPFTAHPKVDPVTGELFSFGYRLLPPYLIYRVISKDGVISDSVPITISHPVMIHDFAITENYAIFMDLPLYFRPKKMVTESKFAFIFDATKKSRFGILPRYAKNEDEMRWFELPNCYVFHTANAWEDEDEVVLIVCRYERLDMEPSVMFSEEISQSFENQLYEMRFNMKTGEASQKKLSVPAVDFPRINENYIGRKQRYVYASIADYPGKIKGVAKFDLESEPELGKSSIEVGGNVGGIYELGDKKYGSEVTFVPRLAGNLSEEDDGYLVFFVYDEIEGKSYANIIDARTMSAQPVAVVELPRRVPFGFHTCFVSEEQCNEQIKLNYTHN